MIKVMQKQGGMLECLNRSCTENISMLISTEGT